MAHAGQPLLRFSIENAQLDERGRALAIQKPVDISGAKKIDGAVCLIMAIAGTIEDAPGAGLVFTV